jgi:hypothetical protein
MGERIVDRRQELLEAPLSYSPTTMLDPMLIRGMRACRSEFESPRLQNVPIFGISRVPLVAQISYAVPNTGKRTEWMSE